MLSHHVAKHFRDVYFGGNWTCSNLKEKVKDITWTEATTEVYELNSIATLVYHIHYFVHAVIQVLEGGKLNAHDKYSFDHPPIRSQEDWENLVKMTESDAHTFALLVEKLPEDKFWEIFCEEKYGNYYRNILGIIEHTHYHLGQIAIIKKIVMGKNKL